jgi:hypothetical protein
VTLTDFFDYLKFAAAIPQQLDLLNFMASKSGRFDLRSKPISSQRSLYALEGKPPKSSVA